MEKEGKLDDLDYLVNSVMEETGMEIPDLYISHFIKRNLVKVINMFRKILGKEKFTAGHMLVPEVFGWLTSGFQKSKN